MSTRSLIGQEQADGTLKGVYCHSDGYLDYNGKMLAEHWRNPEKVEGLMELGDLSFLGHEIGEKVSFREYYGPGQVKAYHRDRGDKKTGPHLFRDRDDMISRMDDWNAEFCYYQDNEGVWWVSQGGGVWQVLEQGSDTFGVFGPSIATGLDYNALEVRTRVNGEEMQHGRSDELILDIPEIVRYVAAVMTLLPGDVIFTGTPGQPQAITPGDVVEVEVTGAGVLRNPVVAGS